ncbi:PD-(D/E)XK nuclease family protein [Cohnella sp.]|uniref:PD-(D/E)XK nuclease family protein n=1 Tax=Cohnella sp. TaxID=1883426 RepID=UPI003566DADA
MNHNWLVDLYEICNNDPFRRKILLADRFDQAEQWLARITRQCGPLLGVETETLRSLVVKRTKLELTKRGLRLLSSEQTFWIIQNLMVDLAVRLEEYIPSEMVSPGIVHSFHLAIEELRLSGIRSSELLITFFDNTRKAIYIIELLTLYEKWLEQNRFTDFAGLLGCLPEKAQINNDLFIVRDVELHSPVEKEMLKRIAGSGLVMLRQEAFFPGIFENFEDHDVRFYCAAGTLAEVRETFRRICRQDIPFDQTEIIVSNYEAYSTAIYTLSQTLDIPCTFSKGMPISYTKVGKAALVYLDWLECNYDVECLLKALRHDYLSFRHFGDSVATADLIRALEQSGIGWGRQRFSMLEAAASAEEAGAHVEAIRLLERAIKGLFHTLPDSRQETWTPLTVLNAMIDFLEKCTVPSGEADITVIAELSDQAKQLESVSPRTLSSESALRYVKDMVTGIRIHCEGPVCGKIHISSLQDGGESGRTHTYILGMSNEAWALQLRQDPVLLDEERRNLGGLQLSTEKAEYVVRERASRLGMLSGLLTLSFVSYDPAEQKETSPAFELLQAARIVTGDPHMDLTGLEHALGKPIGYMAGSFEGEHLLDGTDRWLSRLTVGGRVQDGLPSLRQALRFAAGVERAETKIAAAKLSEYEGMLLQTDVFAVRYLNNPEMFLSVTQLERYAECPKKFFFSTVLKVREKETTDFDRTRWLDAAGRGSLLHRIFYLYLEQMSKDSDTSDILIHNEKRLQEITDLTISEYETMVPPPSPHIFFKECETIRRDVAIFHQLEQKRQGRPRYFELELTRDGEPMEVMLDNGLMIKMKGFVDRVDEVGPHTYKIYDYKTGSPAKYDENEYFSQGTQLQHALYAVAVEQWLQSSGIDPMARVMESAYYFPTEWGKGEEVSRVQSRRAELSELVGHLLASMESGLFTATKESRRCTYCDYRSVCGNESERTKDKWDLAENDSLLHNMKEVERFA